MTYSYFFIYKIPPANLLWVILFDKTSEMHALHNITHTVCGCLPMTHTRETNVVEKGSLLGQCSESPAKQMGVSYHCNQHVCFQ